MLIYPAYYPQFKCLAHRCRHSCCVGWEIDVDEDSLARYQAMPGPLGDKFRASIAQEEGCAHFILGEDERCPFLQPDGLCEMILAQGEDVLCNICRDHPRFYFDYADRTEVGVGLCCEAAAALILGQTEPAALLSRDDPDGPPDPEEIALLDARRRLLSLAQNRTLPLENRLSRLLTLSGLTLPEDWPGALLSLERLDEGWTALAQAAQGAAAPAAPAQWDVPLENLLCYFLYRHIPGALADDDLPGRIALCVWSVQVIRDMAMIHRLPLAEIARMYSAEVEYSEDNVNALLDLFA